MKKIKIVLRNPVNKKEYLDYNIEPYDTELTRDWLEALKNDVLQKELHLEKNYCFMGFPYTHRTVEYLCDQLNKQIKIFNMFNLTETWQKAGLEPYYIEEWFTRESVMFSDPDYPVGNQPMPGLKIKHDIMNRLHNHFERMQGTVWQPSQYYKLATPEVKYAIRQLNLICHELESLILSIRKLKQIPEWVRPSQITTFINCPRHNLKDTHRDGFSNGYDRRFGEVYMHWCQIGKTLMEVYNDEGAPKLTVGDDPTDITVGEGVTCEAINALKYYSGEFDIEWAKDVVYGDPKRPWHNNKIDDFYNWLENNGIDSSNKNLSLGYLPIAKVDTKSAFGTDNPQEVWPILGNHLDIYSIEYDSVKVVYDYNWSDTDYIKRQIELLNG